MNKLILTELASLGVYVTAWFFVSLKLKKNDVADVAWGGGFIVAALTALAFQAGITPRAVLVTTLVIIWGLRLSRHIFLRSRGKPEDARYRKWREQWGRHVVLRSFLQVFLLQGILILIISLPVMMVNAADQTPFTALDYIGVFVWLTGFLFEVIADHQLARFKQDRANKGLIIQTGLWKYSRHPNYFGEVLLWWGIYLIALGVHSGWASLIGPLTISVLILKVSGIPLLEEHYRGNPAFEDYKRRTSAFMPLPPRKDR
jgi:steroid 5-alpha reductase family enzyme